MQDLTAARRKKRRRILLGIVVLLGLLVLFAPAIVAHSPIVNALLTRGLTPAGASATARGATLGWFSPVRLTGVVVVDKSGATLCEISDLAVDRTLLNLLVDSEDLGQIRIESPVVRVDLRSDGSNVEDFLQAYVAARDPNRRPIKAKLGISNATVDVSDRIRGDSWKLHGVAVACDLTGEASRPVATASVSGNVSYFDQSSGAFQLDLSPLTDARQQLEVAVEQLHLTPFASVLARWVTSAQMDGRLSTEATVQWGGDREWQTYGDLNVQGFKLAADFLNQDRLEFDDLRLPWRVSQQGQTLRVEQLDARSDIGELSVRGEVPSNGTDLLEQLAGRLEARLDLSRLASLLPETIALRGDVKVVSGTAELSLRSEQEEGGRSISGSLRTDNLVASREGRTIRWDEPIRISLAARKAAEWSLDNLRLESSFMNGDAAGDRRQFEADFAFDLDRLAAELQQFIDLGAWRLAGAGRFTASWRPEPGNTLSTAQLSGRIDQLRVADGDRTLLREPTLTFAASGQLDRREGELTLLPGGAVQVQAGDDRLTVESKSEWAWNRPDVDASSQSSAELLVEGNLESWIARLEPWIQTPPPAATGGLWLRGNVTQSDSHIHLGPGATLRIDNLRTRVAEWEIDERQLEIQVNRATVARDFSRVELAACKLSSTSASFDFPEIECDLTHPNDPVVRGKGTFITQLERIDAWYRRATERPRDWRVGGQLKGQIELASDANGLHLQLDAEGESIQLYRFVSAAAGQQAGYRAVWSEPRAVLATRADMTDAGHVTLQSLTWSGKKFAAAMEGTIHELREHPQVDLSGSLEYDLAELSGLAQSYLGPGVQLTGREQATSEIQGTLATRDEEGSLEFAANPAPAHWSRQMRIASTAGWSRIDLYGLPIEPGRMDLTLTDGLLSVAPFEAHVGGAGKLRGAARAVIDPPPNLIQLPQGEIVSRVHITPEVSDALLKYIAPVLARVTQSEGAFTVQLAGGQVPVSSPREASLGGHLLVHDARVRPGEAALEWLLLAEQVQGLLRSRLSPDALSRPTRDWLIVEERKVEFQLANGRVHHRGLEFRSGDAVLRSEGSVGLDETLDVLIEIPIRDAWVQRDPWLQGLRGQVIRVRVGGTLSQPRLDRRALSDISRQLLRGAASSALGEGLNRALEGLLRPKP